MFDEDKENRPTVEEDARRDDKEVGQEYGTPEVSEVETAPADSQEPTDSNTISLISEGGGGDKLLGERSPDDRPPDARPALTAEEQKQADREYMAKLTRSLIRSTSSLQPEPDSPTVAISPSKMWHKASSSVEARKSVRFSGAVENESLLRGFELLRLTQLLNFDVYYIGMPDPNRTGTRSRPGTSNKSLSESKQQLVSIGADHDIELGENHLVNDTSDSERTHNESNLYSSETSRMSRRSGGGGNSRDDESLIDELASLNPLQRYINKWCLLNNACRLLKICLSLVAIMITVDKTISTILLCLLSRPDIKRKPGNIGIAYETSDVTMSWTVLVLVNISSMFILYATVINGHSVWRLLSQRLFLVSRQFQYKTMLSLIVFIYLEYILNASFINNLFGWSFETLNDFETLSTSGSSSSSISISSSIISWGRGGFSLKNSTTSGYRPKQAPRSYGIHNSYSVLSNLEIFVTEKHERNPYVDILLTIMQFARGIIRVSPYITINYVIICLNEHIKTIRNQTLLTDSLKKRQKLRMVVKSQRANMLGERDNTGNQSRLSTALTPTSVQSTNKSACNPTDVLSSLVANSSTSGTSANNRKKRVIFATEESGRRQTITSQQRLSESSPNHLTIPIGTSIVRCEEVPPSPVSLLRTTSLPQTSLGSMRDIERLSPSPSSANTSRTNTPSWNGLGSERNSTAGAGDSDMCRPESARKARHSRDNYLDRIEDFDQLESYVTNLYIFTGRLNRLMSQQGLAMFFIVHNLIITCTLIVPEAISGGPPMVYIVRILVIVIGIVPFISGQSLNGQLDQLSKQIDRIIIHQKFISRKRDNLVRIRELLHDIRVNCGGMLNFNVETGIKYLVVAFASAFFIEQEDYKLTRRH